MNMTGALSENEGVSAVKRAGACKGNYNRWEAERLEMGRGR